MSGARKTIVIPAVPGLSPEYYQIPFVYSRLRSLWATTDQPILEPVKVADKFLQYKCTLPAVTHSMTDEVTLTALLQRKVKGLSSLLIISLFLGNLRLALSELHYDPATQSIINTSNTFEFGHRKVDGCHTTLTSDDLTNPITPPNYRALEWLTTMFTEPFSGKIINCEQLIASGTLLSSVDKDDLLALNSLLVRFGNGPLCQVEAYFTLLNILATPDAVIKQIIDSGITFDPEAKETTQELTKHLREKMFQSIKNKRNNLEEIVRLNKVFMTLRKSCNNHLQTLANKIAVLQPEEKSSAKIAMTHITEELKKFNEETYVGVISDLGEDKDDSAELRDRATTISEEELQHNLNPCDQRTFLDIATSEVASTASGVVKTVANFFPEQTASTEAIAAGTVSASLATAAGAVTQYASQFIFWGSRSADQSTASSAPAARPKSP